MTNKDLMKMIKEAFPDLALGYWEEFPYTKYSNEYILEKLSEIEEKLWKQPADTGGSVELSRRQRYLAIDIIDLCNKSEKDGKMLGDVIHQLHDCIDNFGEKEHLVCSSELMLYRLLINLVIKTAKLLNGEKVVDAFKAIISLANM